MCVLMIKENHPFIQQFIDKHKIALSTNSKEIKFTIQEANNLIIDIHSLIGSVFTKLEDNRELKALIQQLLIEIKELNSSEADGGKF